MLILRAGLYLAAAMACVASWLSWQAGYAVEVATVRGLVVFMGISFVAYLAELVVMTAPLPNQRTRASANFERDPSARATDRLGDADEPVNLPAVRATRDAAGESRAA
jgi:hypothetical protein